MVDATGGLVARHGDVERPFFIRSSAKPFQALVSQEAGAELDPLELAMACASHRGFPVQIALVDSMLARAGLDESHLGCPPAWPLSPDAARLVARSGGPSKRRIWHNCSGKHAGFLRACVGAGWPIESYLDPGHPLQLRVIELIRDLGDQPVEPVGVDGCGAPVLRTTVAAMARLYARLATDDLFRSVRAAMHRYPALVGANGEADTEIAIALDGVAKGGAAGCIGVAVSARLGLAVKSWDGEGSVASLGAVAVLDRLGVLSPVARSTLDPFLRPAVWGGGKQVGVYQTTFDLETV